MRKVILALATISTLGFGAVTAHAQDALGGALLGAGAGAIIGGAASGRGDGAVAGAIIGGTAGAIIGSQSDQHRGYRRSRPDYEEAPVYYQRPAYRERTCWQDDWGRTVCR